MNRLAHSLAHSLPRVAALAAVAVLAGCSTAIQVCPVPAILSDTATYTAFRPGTTPDLANELYSVSLINADTDCRYTARTGNVRSSLDLTFRATRAPSADRARYTVPYFVVAHEGAKIFTKRLFNLTFEFAPGASTTTINQSPDETTIHVENGKLPWNYQLISGFQLTPEQIAYNKQKARYAP